MSKDEMFFKVYTGDIVKVRKCFDCDTSVRGEGFLEAYIKTGSDEEFNPYEYLGELNCPDDASNREIIEAIEELL